MGSDVVLTFDGAHGTVCCDGIRPVRSASYSALSSWSQCPGRWLGSRVLPTLYDWASPLTVGSIAHGALELAVGEPDVDAPDWGTLALRAVGMLRERNLATGWKPDPIPAGVSKPDGSPAHDADWAALAAAKLHGFRLSDVFGVPLHPAATEQGLRETVWGVPMSGSVDYRDAERGVVDWKTGRVPRPDPDGLGHADQLRVYRALLETAGVCEVRQARDVYVERRVAVPADLSDGAMASTGSKLARAWESMNGCMGRGVFPLRPSALCGWCPLANACPVAVVSGAKARTAAARQYPADYPAFRRTGTHQAGATVESEEHMDLDDLLTQMMTPSGGTPSEPDRPKAEPRPRPVEGVDPWASAAGREALDKWGVKPAEPPKAVEHKPEPKEEAKPVKPEPKKERPEGVALTVRRPYDPSLSDGVLNVAGYGFGHLESLSCTAALLCGGALCGSVDRVLMALLRLEWRTARDVWGGVVPDVPGLAEGEPDRAALLAWLDSPLSRDVARVFGRIMESADMFAHRDIPPDEKALLDDLDTVSKAAVQALAPARELLRA